jgi:hypothetical protein
MIKTCLPLRAPQAGNEVVLPPLSGIYKTRLRTGRFNNHFIFKELVNF